MRSSHGVVNQAGRLKLGRKSEKKGVLSGFEQEIGLATQGVPK